MSLRLRNVVSVALLGAVTLAWSGCTAKKQTEYVAGISTQVQVPRDMKAVRVDLYKGGINVFCQVYKVYNGRVQLPNSLGSFRAQSNDDGVPLTVTITGFTDDFTEGSSNAAYSDCQHVTQVTQDSARVLRRSRQPYQTDKVLFLPMPLKYSCFDVNCDKDNAPGETQCKGGLCRSIDVDPNKLVEFDPDLVDGSGGNCFHVTDCFAAALPASTVDDATCTYAVPGTPSALPVIDGGPKFPSSGDGVNVQVIYDGGVGGEVLDKDPDEGFIIPDPAKPQQFRLAPGLCALVHGYDDKGALIPPDSHRITGIRTSGLCQAKSINQPICYGDQLNSMTINADGSSSSGLSGTCRRIPLVASPSAVIVLVDDTQDHVGFYTAGANGVGAQTIDFTLSSPSFANAEAGLMYFPGPNATAASCAAQHPLAVDVQNARAAHQKILDDIGDRVKGGSTRPLNPAGTSPDLDGALRDAYSILEQPGFANFYRRAVLVIGNRGLDAKTCSAAGAPQLAQDAFAAPPPIETYVLELVGNPSASEGGFLAPAGGTVQPYNVPVNGSTQAQAAAQKIINDLNTCAYDIPAGTALSPTATLSYTSPHDGKSHEIHPAVAGTCVKDGDTGEGWGIDAKNPARIRVCGNACATYQDSVFKATALQGFNNPPQQSIPIPMFAYQADAKADKDADCAPKDNVLPPGVGGQ
jgi:hypothetical protein